MSQDTRYRLGGAALVVVGVAFAWWAIGTPLARAAEGAETISWQLRAVVIVPAALVFGLFLLIAGDRHPYRNAEQQTLTPVGWALIAAVAVSTAVLYFWMQGRLASLGYA